MAQGHFWINDARSVARQNQNESGMLLVLGRNNLTSSVRDPGVFRRRVIKLRQDTAKSLALSREGRVHLWISQSQALGLAFVFSCDSVVFDSLESKTISENFTTCMKFIYIYILNFFPIKLCLKQMVSTIFILQYCKGKQHLSQNICHI